MARKNARKKKPAPVRHRPRVVRSRGELGIVYRLVCTCGQSGREWYSPSPAREELDRHVTTLPLVPDAQQCAQPKQHDRRPWEPCSLCEGQEGLFDLEVAS